MNVFLSNDDGIFALGLHRLAEYLHSLPDVKLYVFAPDRERSAAGMSLTLREPIHVEPYDFPGAEMAFSVAGTPVDCVRFGVHYLRDRGIEPDLLCAGINHGSNIGGDVYFSGTVSAAVEGVMKGVPAIAFSLREREGHHFELFEKLVPQVVEKSLGRIPPLTVINVNAPDLPASEIKGLRVCRLGRRYFKEWYEDLGDGDFIWRYGPMDLPEDAETADDLDSIAVPEGYITVGPVSIRAARPGAMEEIESWGLEF
jgi:5'-nucleotidase